MLVLLARGDQWNAWQSLLKQVGSILNDPRTEKNPKAPPNCQYVEVDDRQGFQHPVPKGCTAGIHAGCGFHWQEEPIAPPEKVPLGPGKEPNVNRTVDTSSSDFRKAVIGPGQLVYLPKNWWHEVPFAYSDTYASCSSSSIGMHCTDSRTDSPQSLLFFPDTPGGADNPRGCYDCGDVVRGP